MDQLRPLKQGPAVPAHYCFPYIHARYIQAILMHAWASPPAERASACLPCTAGWLQSHYTIASVCHARSLSVQMLVLVGVTRLRSYSVVATWRQRCEKKCEEGCPTPGPRQTPPRQRSRGAHAALRLAHVIAQCVRAVWDRYDIAVIFVSR